MLQWRWPFVVAFLLFVCVSLLGSVVLLRHRGSRVLAPNEPRSYFITGLWTYGSASSCQGTAGFIGYSIARQLLQQNETVVGLDNFDPFYDVDLKFHRNRLLKRFEQYRFYRGGLISHCHCNVSRCLQPKPALGALCCPQVPAIVVLSEANVPELPMLCISRARLACVPRSSTRTTMWKKILAASMRS
jgi:hypothetical protein